MQHDQGQKSKRTINVIWLLVLVSVCMFSTGLSWAQATQQFTGRVVDSTGAVVPDADVLIHNQSTAVDTKTVTTGTGDYTVPYLIPGTYDIAVSKQGFKTVKKTDILLNVGQTSTISFALQVGAVTETVTVNSSAVQLELNGQAMPPLGESGQPGSVTLTHDNLKTSAGEAH